MGWLRASVIVPRSEGQITEKMVAEIRPAWHGGDEARMLRLRLQRLVVGEGVIVGGRRVWRTGQNTFEIWQGGKAVWRTPGANVGTYIAQRYASNIELLAEKLSQMKDEDTMNQNVQAALRALAEADRPLRTDEFTSAPGPILKALRGKAYVSEAEPGKYTITDVGRAALSAAGEQTPTGGTIDMPDPLLKARIVELGQIVSEKQQQIDRQKRQLDEQAAKIDALQRQLGDITRQGMSAAAGDVQAEVRALRDEIERWKQQAAEAVTLADEVQTLRATIDELKAGIAQKDAQIDAWIDVVRGRDDELKAARRHQQALTLIAQHVPDVQTVIDQLAALDDALERLKARSGGE